MKIRVDTVIPDGKTCTGCRFLYYGYWCVLHQQQVSIKDTVTSMKIEDCIKSELIPLW